MRYGVSFSLVNPPTYSNPVVWQTTHSASYCRFDGRVAFFEHDVPYYATNRDLFEVPGGDLVLYRTWDEIRAQAAREIAAADVAVVTSYCPHGLEASPEGVKIGRVRETRILIQPSQPRIFDAVCQITDVRFAHGEIPFVLGGRIHIGIGRRLRYEGRSRPGGHGLSIACIPAAIAPMTSMRFSPT